MTAEDMLLVVDEWRTLVPGRTVRPSGAACDAAQHILLMCRTAGIEPTRVEFSAAESVLIVFTRGELYCDIEIEWDGSLQAVAPGQDVRGPTVWAVPDTDEAITVALMRIHAHMGAQDKIPELDV